MTDIERARAVAETYCTAWRTGDLAGLLDCYAEDFVLHYFGDNPYAGSHHGRDAAAAVLATVSTIAPRTLLGIDEITAGPGAAVIVARERLERDGEAHELRRVLRYRVEDERFVECWLYDEDQRLVDHLWRA